VNRLLRASAVLAVLVALLGLVAWLEPGLKREQGLPSLTELSPAAARSLRLFKGNDLVLGLELTEQGWHLNAPVAGVGDNERVRELLGLLRTPSLRRFPVPPERHAEFGLAEPEFILEVDGVPIAFGGLDPVTQQRYVLYAGEVHLIGDGFRHHLLAGPQGFRAGAR
jgi:hypothetical protein